MATVQDGFKQALEDFKKRLKPEEEAKFAVTSLNDLQIALKDIQEMQRKTKTAQNLKRIEPFLQAMAQYQGIIEVFLNTSSLLCFIWGPMKFMLLIANNWSKSFDILLDTYKQIAENFPLLLKYRSMFAENDHMKKVLVWIYEDILKFHLRAWRVFSQPAWKQLFNATWKDFQECFKPIQNDLIRHRELIESTANLEQIQESRDARLQSQAAFSALEKEQKYSNTIAVVAWLSSADPSEDHDAFLKAKEDFPDTGQWILRDPKIMEWLDASDCSVPMFWLNGIPGAGKTILASVVIEEALKLVKLKDAVSVAFFYCKDQDGHRNKFPSVAKAMLAQLLQQNPDILPYLFDECQKSCKVTLVSPKDCARILATVLQAVPKTFIIIDGIDECEPKERKVILEFFTSVINDDENERGKLRGLFVSQDLGDIRSALHTAEILRLTEEHSILDIQSYTVKWSRKIQGRFENSTHPMPEEAREYIVRLVCEGAAGMFLFAKLVLENLFGQEHLEGIYKELTPEIFPHGFDQAYARIVDRIFSNPNVTQQRTAKRLVGWITFAKRPLKWQEIQGATSIDIEQGIVNFRGRQLPDDIRNICGSLVEILPGDRVQLVHATARRYLVECKEVDVKKEETQLALLCLRYLTFNCFDENLDYDAIRRFVNDGVYAFLDYACLHWNHHLETVVHLSQPEDLSHSADLSTAVNEFFEAYEPGLMVQDDANKKYLQRFAAIEAAESYESIILLLITAYRNRSTEDQLEALGRLGKTITKVRAILEELGSSAMTDQLLTRNLQQFYGHKWYKCSRHMCFYFHEGFTTEKGLLQHINKHEKPFCCTEMGCTRMYIGWSTQKELNKHMSQFHPDPETFSWKFPHVKKPPTTFQCKLCSKQYTRANTLKTHTLREHAKEKPFICKTCGKGFVRKYECDRHESIHRDKSVGSAEPSKEGEAVATPEDKL